MTFIQRLFSRHYVSGHISVVDHHFTSRLDRPRRIIRKVVACHTGFHARKCERFRHVYGLDSGMCMRASQYLSVKHIWQVSICTKFCPTGDFVDAVWSACPSADPFQGFIPGFTIRYRIVKNFLYCCGHVYVLISAAVSSTARTILS